MGGALLGAAFLTPALGVLAWFAFVPLLEGLEARLRARLGAGALFRLGWLFGFVAFLVGIHWIARLSAVAITVPWLRYPAWIAAAAYLALFPGLAAMVAGLLARRGPFSLAVTFPVAYTVVEGLRGAGELGFPWFQPAYSQHAFPPLIQMAALGGATLVTVWVLALNALLWRAFTGRARRLAAAGVALALLLPWSWGTRVLAVPAVGEGPVVALVQGNIPGEMKWSGHHQEEILDRFLRLSAGAAGGVTRPVILIWPETATGSYIRKDAAQTLAVLGLAERTGLPVFSGYADYDLGTDGRVKSYNAAGMFNPDGTGGERYAKRHLVPFGERMPFQWLLPGIGKLELGQAEWTPGAGPVLFPSAAGPFACLVCFESIFPKLAREDVRRGARWLVNITNDDWFGNSPALTQHAAMAVFRAVENGVPLARCANTGITQVIDGRGRVVSRLPVYREGALLAALPAALGPTPFNRFGDWPGGLAAAALAVLLALAALRTRGPRRNR